MTKMMIILLLTFFAFLKRIENEILVLKILSSKSHLFSCITLLLYFFCPSSFTFTPIEFLNLQSNQTSGFSNFFFLFTSSCCNLLFLFKSICFFVTIIIIISFIFIFIYLIPDFFLKHQSQSICPDLFLFLSINIFVNFINFYLKRFIFILKLTCTLCSVISS